MRPVAVSGVGDIAAGSRPASFGALLAWGAVLGVTVGIIVGTLSLKPRRA